MNPHIVKFKTEDSFYVYSSILNDIFFLNKEQYDALDNISFRDQDIASSELVKSLRLDINPIRMKCYLRPHEIEDELNNSLRQLLLNTTEDCNLRCHYCINSGNYRYFRRYSRKKMNLVIAKKAADYFIQKSNNQSLLGISFYGGEPLLNFDLILNTVNYINGRTNKSKIYSVNTNGTLLNNDIIKFFVENNFVITFSLDGPKCINDRYRKYIDNRGTFDTITNNLRSIYDYSHDYFKSNIFIKAVITPPYSYERILTFFRNDNLVSKAAYVGVGYVKDNDCSVKFDKYDEEDFNGDLRYIKNEIFNYFLSKPKINDKNILYNFKIKSFVPIINRQRGFIDFMNEFIYVPGICLPGKRKLFVDCDGNYHMCEKIEQSIPIGNVNSGIDVKKVKELINKYCELGESDCCNCWAKRLCGLCFANAIRGGKIDISFKREYCIRQRQDILNNLIMYVSILEKRNDAFENLRECAIQ